MIEENIGELMIFFYSEKRWESMGAGQVSVPDGDDENSSGTYGRKHSIFAPSLSSEKAP